MNAISNNRGSALIVVLMSFVVISILGMAIIGVTTAEHNLTKIDGRSQSTYYIAEAGVNYALNKLKHNMMTIDTDFLSAEDFFDHLNNQFAGDANKYVFDVFEENYGEQPKATITLIDLGSSGDDENTMDYKIVSMAEIGNSTRTASTEVSITLKPSNDKILSDVLFYSKKFSFKGTAVNAPSGSIIMDGVVTHNLNGGSLLNVSNLYFNGPVKMDGGSASLGCKDEPGVIYVKGDLDLWEGGRNVFGDIRVAGTFRLKDAKIRENENVGGNVYVEGDVELGWTPTIDKNIYYTGNLTAPDNYDSSLLNKCIKVSSVDSFQIPVVDNIKLREESWYKNNDYDIIKDHVTKPIPANAKMLVDSYYNKEWQDIKGEVIIISKGDIVLRGGNGFTGALISINGKVEYSGDGTFNGVIISREEINLPKGGNEFNFKGLTELFGDDVPVIAGDQAGGQNGSGSVSTSVIITQNKGIREE